MPKESDFLTVTTSFLLTCPGSSQLGYTRSFFSILNLTHTHTEDHVDTQFLTDSRNYVHICILVFTSENTGAAKAKWDGGTYPAFPAVAETNKPGTHRVPSS